MSKQLAISAAFSVFAMSVFVLLGTGSASASLVGNTALAQNATGAETLVSTPAAKHSEPAPAC
mgnify:CR=1 FL=1